MVLNDAENFLGNDQALLFVARTKTVVYRGNHDFLSGNS